MMRARLLAAGLALLMSACAPLTVNSYLQTGTDMARLRTYAWAPQDGLATGDARLDNNPFVDTATRAAVDRALAQKGLEKSERAPDVLFHYHLSLKQQLDVAAESTYLRCDGCVPTVYEAGTLVIDAVDARTNQLLWRGWAESSFDRLVEDQAALERRIGETVTKIVARYPYDASGW